MPAIVEFPTVVNEAVDVFGHHFANEPERKHFAEYLTGLFIAQNKNVSEINRQFAHTTDQSCLNRWVTEADWDVQEFLSVPRARHRGDGPAGRRRTDLPPPRRVNSATT